MSVENQPLELLTSAQAALRQIKEALRAPAPRAITDCGAPLCTAAEALRRLHLQSEPGEVGGGAPRDAAYAADVALLEPLAKEVQRDLSEVKQLLEQAGAFYLDRFQMLESATGAYDASGELSAPAGNALSVRG